MDSSWYKGAVIYELSVQAFCDSNSDGHGDFPGLIQKLDYLRNLGVSAISILPFYPSPPRGDGYDMIHYELVDPRYGTIHDFQTFLREAHARGMRVLIEHRLFQHQPNVNVDWAYVRRAVLRVTRHWLDMGVDGLRLGTVADAVERDGARSEDLRKTHDILREIRQFIDQHYPGRVLVADEDLRPEGVVKYFVAIDRRSHHSARLTRCTYS